MKTIVLHKPDTKERVKRNKIDPYLTSYRIPIDIARGIEVRAKKAGISLTEAVVQVLAGFVAGTTAPRGIKSTLKPSKHARDPYNKKVAKKAAKKAIAKAKSAVKAKSAKKVKAKAKKSKTAKANKPAPTIAEQVVRKAKRAARKVAKKISEATTPQLDRQPPESEQSREEKHEAAVENAGAES